MILLVWLVPYEYSPFAYSPKECRRIGSSPPMPIPSIVCLGTGLARASGCLLGPTDANRIGTECSCHGTRHGAWTLAKSDYQSITEQKCFRVISALVLVLVLVPLLLVLIPDLGCGSHGQVQTTENENDENYRKRTCPCPRHGTIPLGK